MSYRQLHGHLTILEIHKILNDVYMLSQMLTIGDQWSPVETNGDENSRPIETRKINVV